MLGIGGIYLWRPISFSYSAMTIFHLWYLGCDYFTSVFPTLPTLLKTHQLRFRPHSKWIYLNSSPRTQIHRFFRQAHVAFTFDLQEAKKPSPHLCTRNLCPGRGDAAGGTRKRENAKTRKRQARKREKTKTRKRENGENTIHSVALWTRMLSQIWACVRYVRQQSIPYTSNTNFITALGMCKVCTEAAQSVALWTWTLSQLWACVCTEAVLPVALWTWTLSQLWACVKYVPKQSIA